MKKSQLLELLQNVKSGKVKIDEAISEAETSRRSLVWEQTSIKATDASRLIKGFLYKVEANGTLAKLPEARDGKVFQPYYRSLNPKPKKAKVTK